MYTSHSTPGTLHLTLYTTLYMVHFTLYTLYFILYTPHSTRDTPPPTLDTAHFTLHSLHLTLYTSHCTLYAPHSTLHSPHSTLQTLHFHTLHLTLHFRPSQLCLLSLSTVWHVCVAAVSCCVHTSAGRRHFGCSLRCFFSCPFSKVHCCGEGGPLNLRLHVRFQRSIVVAKVDL